MSSNGLYVAPPKLRMQCGLPPTLGDTSYPEKGQKNGRKANALRRMHRRNATNKWAKAQNKAGSPQAAEESPRTGKQDTNQSYESDDTETLTHAVPSEGLELAAKDAEVVRVCE